MKNKTTSPTRLPCKPGFLTSADAAGLYVSACAFSFSKRSPHSPYTILSRFNGLFFTLYETRQILGNLLSSVVLRDGVGNKSEEIIFKLVSNLLHLTFAVREVLAASVDEVD